MNVSKLNARIEKYDEGIRVEVDVPGYSKSEVAIESRLNEFGERIVYVTAVNLKRGRSVAVFVAKDMLDMHRSDAEMVDGLLTIDLPFSKEFKTTTIPIM